MIFRKFLWVLSLVVATASVPACDSGSGHWSPRPPRPPGLGHVPSRIAHNATALATVVGEDRNDVIIASDDPSVVEVERISFTDIELRAVGVGDTIVTIEEGLLSNEYAIEVRAHDRFEVLHAEKGWPVDPVSVGSLRDRLLLAGVSQDIIVAYYDSDGLLSGGGLASFRVPGSACGTEFDRRFDTACWIPREGDGSVRVSVQGEEAVFVPFTAVAAEDIVDILLLRVDEQDAEPGDVLHVEVVGATSHGKQVNGMHATIFGIKAAAFAYQYDAGRFGVEGPRLAIESGAIGSRGHTEDSPRRRRPCRAATKDLLDCG